MIGLLEDSHEVTARRFAGCGHAFMAQEPERLAGLVAAFLAR